LRSKGGGSIVIREIAKGDRMVSAMNAEVARVSLLTCILC
jgi:hypothetical protein